MVRLPPYGKCMQHFYQGKDKFSIRNVALFHAAEERRLS
jgi:hypothetical protein